MNRYFCCESGPTVEAMPPPNILMATNLTPNVIFRLRELVEIVKSEILFKSSLAQVDKRGGVPTIRFSTGQLLVTPLVTEAIQISNMQNWTVHLFIPGSTASRRRHLLLSNAQKHSFYPTRNDQRVRTCDVS
jgi:hypothetical protein